VKPTTTPAAADRRPPARPRWEALDDLRGLAIFIMVPVNVVAPYAAIPSWFKHAPGPGLTIPDLVVPLFLFSLGVSAGLSWKRRLAEKGYGRTLLHAVVRNGLLAAFGVAGMLLADPGDRWEVLTMLGATGMFAFFFLGLRPWPRIGAALLVLAAVEVLRPLGLGSLIEGWYDTGLGGPWGTFSLSFFAITASALGELIIGLSAARKLGVLAGAAAALAACGAVALILGPFSKHLLSASYILFTAGVSAALLAGIEAWREVLRLPLPLLGSLGRNPLLLYIIHAVLGLAVLAMIAAGSAAWMAWTAGLGVLAVCTALAVLLDRLSLYVKL
jgi:predicted acyltransferase